MNEDDIDQITSAIRTAKRTKRKYTGTGSWHDVNEGMLEVQYAIADVLKDTVPRFDRDKFIDDCEVFREPTE